MTIIPSNLLGRIGPQARVELEGAASSLSDAARIIDAAPAMRNAAPGTKELSFGAMNDLTQRLDDALAYGERFIAETADPLVTNYSVVEVGKLGVLLGGVRGAGLAVSLLARDTPVEQMRTPIHDFISSNVRHTADAWRAAADEAL